MQLCDSAGISQANGQSIYIAFICIGFINPVLTLFREPVQHEVRRTLWEPALFVLSIRQFKKPHFYENILSHISF